MSVTDWLNKGRPMIHDDNPPKAFPRTDAEFLADVAIAALQDGRYELARELTRLAAQAKHMEMTAQPRLVPMLGQTREEQPAGSPDNPPTLQLAVPPPTARCWYSSATGVTCEQQAYLDRPNRVWRHIDPDLDQHHEPLVNDDAH